MAEVPENGMSPPHTARTRSSERGYATDALLFAGGFVWWPAGVRHLHCEVPRRPAPAFSGVPLP